MYYLLLHFNKHLLCFIRYIYFHLFKIMRMYVFYSAPKAVGCSIFRK